MVEMVLEGTFALIMAFLILSNALQFGQVINALSSGYTRAVQVLQGKTPA